MRGADVLQESLFTVRKLDDFVPVTHPLRPIRDRVNQALVRLDGLFARMYAEDAKGGRPSIAPEKLLRAMLLQVFYSIRSERQLMEQTDARLLSGCLNTIVPQAAQGIGRLTRWVLLRRL